MFITFVHNFCSTFFVPNTLFTTCVNNFLWATLCLLPFFTIFLFKLLFTSYTHKYDPKHLLPAMGNFFIPNFFQNYWSQLLLTFWAQNFRSQLLFIFFFSKLLLTTIDCNCFTNSCSIFLFEFLYYLYKCLKLGFQSSLI